MDRRFSILLTDRQAYIAEYQVQHRQWVLCERFEFDMEIPLRLQDDTDLVPLANALAEKVLQIYPEGIICRLVIPAGWCLLQQIELSGDRWNEKAARFELEQYLSLELESLTCIFKRMNNTNALGIAVLTKPLLSFVKALEAKLICPEIMPIDAFLVEHLTVNDAENVPEGYVLVDQSRLVLMLLEDPPGSVKQIRMLQLPHPDDLEELYRQVSTTISIFEAFNKRWEILQLCPDSACLEDDCLLQELGGKVEVQSHHTTLEQVLQTVATCDDLLDIRQQDLCCSGRWAGLYRKGTRCALALAALLFVVCIKNHFDSSAYAQPIEDIKQMQENLYQEVYPQKPMPLGAAYRIKSERKRLEGLTEGSGESVNLLARNGQEPLQIMLQIIEHIPKKMLIDVSKIDLSDSYFKLQGRLKDHSVAGRLVQGLNQIEFLEVNPPRTDMREDKTVDFTISAQKISNE